MILSILNIKGLYVFRDNILKYLTFIPDLLIIGGLAGIHFGLYLRMPWVAYTVTGGLVFAIGVCLSLPRKGK